MELAPKDGLGARHGGMIDNAEKTEQLLAKLQAALPMPARATPELIATLLAQTSVTELPTDWTVTAVSYSGDEGGIVCRINLHPMPGNAVFASITHLRFDPRLPLAREIAAYQKHRVKRLRRQGS
jgi:hypothetical protein